MYYLAAMLEGGEDARFIARRMIVLASEDIGIADPRALLVAVAAAQAVEHVGLAGGAAQPRAGGDLPRARAEVERELRGAQRGVRGRARARPPQAAGLAPRRPLLRSGKLGHGEGYVYPHDDPSGFDVDYLPDELKGRTYYEPRGAARSPDGVRLHTHEWGDPGAPPLVCLHGVTGHGERFRDSPRSTGRSGSG